MSSGGSAAVERPWERPYAVTPRSDRVQADGVQIAVSIWEPSSGATGGPDVVLVHGGAAQRQWWDHLAPLVRGSGRVVALDLSGHGDSQHREQYTLDAWSREVLEIAQLYCAAPPVLVGHSMGGIVAVNAAQSEPDKLAAILALDSPLRRDATSHVERRSKIASRPVRSFGSYAEASSGYKTSPPVPDASAEVISHIAQAAYRRVEDRWALKYDPRIYLRPQVDEDFVQVARIPTWWVQAENGFIDESMAQRIRDSIGPAGVLLKVPAASHHLVLEQPLATVWIISLFLQLHAGR